eukprot:1237584-Rhodomonas_salina.1
MTNRVAVEAMGRWAERVAEGKRSRGVLSKVRRRWTQQSVLRAFAEWSDRADEERAQRRKLVEIVRRLMFRGVSSAFETWRRLRQGQTRTLEMLQSVAKRMRHLRVSAALDAWQSGAEAAQREKRVLDRAVERGERQAVRGALEQWQLNTFEVRVHCSMGVSVLYFGQGRCRCGWDAAGQVRRQCNELAQSVQRTALLRQAALVATLLCHRFARRRSGRALGAWRGRQAWLRGLWRAARALRLRAHRALLGPPSLPSPPRCSSLLPWTWWREGGRKGREGRGKREAPEVCEPSHSSSLLPLPLPSPSPISLWPPTTVRIPDPRRLGCRGGVEGVEGGVELLGRDAAAARARPPPPRPPPPHPPQKGARSRPAYQHSAFRQPFVATTPCSPRAPPRLTARSLGIRMAVPWATLTVLALCERADGAGGVAWMLAGACRGGAGAARTAPPPLAHLPPRCPPRM